MEPNNNRNFVKLGVLTIFNRQNSYYIYIVFKNKLSSNVDIESLNFGKIEKSTRDERVYLKEVNANNSQNDTISLKFSDKIYKFYHVTWGNNVAMVRGDESPDVYGHEFGHIIQTNNQGWAWKQQMEKV